MTLRTRLACIALGVVLALFMGGALAQGFDGAPRRFKARHLAVIVNNDDPQSVAIGDYYRKRRGISEANIIRVRFAPGGNAMPLAEFREIKATVDATATKDIQAYALTWMKPWRIECLSITSAFAAGFDPAYCAVGCKPTRLSPYYDSNSWAPNRHYRLRPTMMLAAKDAHEAFALIDRGVRADATFPRGTGYLLETSDKTRSIRARQFPPLLKLLGHSVRLNHVRAEYIESKPDVLFYFTGQVDVPKLDTNTFVPGAIADHLTSTGGVLTGGSQMSSLRWLEAGATGSYGTVVEPCNLPAKFPNPYVVIARYLRGESLVEAYWKSVAMPGQGVFIGEPLASPFARD